MDPLSILSSAAGITGLCIKVSGILYTFVDDARGVDDTVAGLCEEITGLQRVTDAIGQSWKQNPLLAAAETTGDRDLWITVRASLDDCKITLGKLDKRLTDSQKTSFLGRGFLRKPTMSIKLNMMMKDINAFQQQIHSHNSAMQSAFQMISVLLLLRSGSSQESISRVLGDLKTQIGRVEVAVRTRNDAEPPSPDLLEDNERISRNLRQFVRVAESFHSSASTVVGEGTVWGGSVFGDPLSDDQAQRIENWIPPPTIEEEGTEATESISGTTDDFEQDSDPDSDMEREFVKNFHNLAISSFTAGDYNSAERFFNKVVNRSTEDLPGGVVKVKLMQAYAYGKQARWRDAENVLASLTTMKRTNEPMAFDGLHALALLKLQGDAHDAAIRYCKKALMGRRRVGGKESAPFYESMALLALIHEKKGDTAEAGGCRGFLPAGYKEEVDVGFLQYLARPLRDHVQDDKVSDTASPVVVVPVTHSPSSVLKRGKILFDFRAQGNDEVTVEVGDEVLILNDKTNTGWWKVRRVINGTEGVVPMDFIDITENATMTSSHIGFGAGLSVGTTNAPDSASTISTGPTYPPPPPSPAVSVRPQPMETRSPTHPQSYRPPTYPAPQPKPSKGSLPQPQSQRSPFPTQNLTPYPYGPSGSSTQSGSPKPLSPEQSHPPSPYGQKYGSPAPLTNRHVRSPSSSSSLPVVRLSPSPSYYPPLPPPLPAVQLSPSPSFYPPPPPPLPAVDGSHGQVIIGIDIGPIESSVAFAYVFDKEAKEDIVTDWPGSISPKSKIPSSIYYDLFLNIVGWGLDIGSVIGPHGYPKPGITKVEWFPLYLELECGGSVSLGKDLPALPKGKSGFQAFGEYLHCLRKATFASLERSLGAEIAKNFDNIQYYFSLPPIYTDRAVEQFRKAIVLAGFVPNANDPHLHFISGPVATAHYGNKTGLLNLKKKDAILIVDCPGTVDVIALEVLSQLPFKVTDLTAGTGEACGSFSLNQNYSRLLRSKLRRMKLPAGSTIQSKIYAKAIIDFENRIKTDFRNNGQKWAVDLGIEQDFPDADIEEGYLTWTNEEILQCFKPVVDSILELVRNQITEVQASNSHLQTIFVVGPFATSEYLFEQLKAFVLTKGPYNVVRPIDSALYVARGLVTAGIMEVIGGTAQKPAAASIQYPPPSSRSALKTPTSAPKICTDNYYFSVPEFFIPGVHHEMFRLKCPDRDRCLYTATKVMSRGQLLTDPTIRIPVSKMVRYGDSLALTDTLWSCYEDCWPDRFGKLYMYTDQQTQINWIDGVYPTWLEPGPKLAAEVYTDFSRYSPDRDFRKFRNEAGAWYLIEYEIAITFPEIDFEVFFKGGSVQNVSSKVSLDSVNAWI